MWCSNHEKLAAGTSATGSSGRLKIVFLKHLRVKNPGVNWNQNLQCMNFFAKLTYVLRRTCLSV